MPDSALDLAPEPIAKPSWLQNQPTEEYVAEGASSGHSLSTHARQLQKRSKGFSGWFGFAVVIGAIAAFALITFFVH